MFSTSVPAAGPWLQKTHSLVLVCVRQEPEEDEEDEADEAPVGVRAEDAQVSHTFISAGVFVLGP